MPKELVEGEKTNYKELGSGHLQTVEEIMRIIQEAKIPGEGSRAEGQSGTGSLDLDDVEGDLDSEIDVSGDFAGSV